MKPGSLLPTLFLFAALTSYSQSAKEQLLKTEIKEVTVFLSTAQIFEKGNISFPAGKTILKVKGLSPFVDSKSVQVKAEGDFTILSVNHKVNYLQELRKGSTIDSLNRANDILAMKIADDNSLLEIISEKQSILNENKKFGTPTSGLSVLQLKQAIDFYEVELLKMKQDGVRIRRDIFLQTKEQKRIEQQLREVQEQKALPSGEIEIRVDADSPVTTTFSLSYLVANAGWYPKYDIRVKDVKKPLELTYKAEVFQNTGVDWKNVRLRFSNADPRQSGLMPELSKWNLSYSRYTVFAPKGLGFAPGERNVHGIITSEGGGPMPGVNVVVKGSSIGTVTDANGRYDLTLPNDFSSLVVSFIGYSTREIPISQPQINVRLEPDSQQLDEVIVTGYSDGTPGSPPQIRIRGVSSIKSRDNFSKYVSTTVIENQTTVEIGVDVPYSIYSNGEKLVVDLKKYQIDATYQYFATPKLDKDAFLVAQITNWDQYNLLDGEANLYFEDAYIGRSVLDAKALKDTLTLSLGRDKSIVISRAKSEQFSKRKILGGNIVENRVFAISIRNKKSQPISLKIFDQVPVSVIDDVSVNVLESSGGQLDQSSGKISWSLEINAQQQKEISLQYEVRYPRKEKVNLE